MWLSVTGASIGARVRCARVHRPVREVEARPRVPGVAPRAHSAARTPGVGRTCRICGCANRRLASSTVGTASFFSLPCGDGLSPSSNGLLLHPERAPGAGWMRALKLPEMHKTKTAPGAPLRSGPSPARVSGRPSDGARSRAARPVTGWYQWRFHPPCRRRCRLRAYCPYRTTCPRRGLRPRRARAPL